MTDLVVVGNISQDTVTYGQDTRPTFLGGAGLNISLAAARSGKRPKLVSVVGGDVLDYLGQLKDKIDISLVMVTEGTTCRFHIHYSNSGTLQQIHCDFGVSQLLNSHIGNIPLAFAHYHVCCRNPLAPSLLLSQLVDNRFPFSVDFILSSAIQQIEQIRHWLQYAQYVFVNRQEYRILQDYADINTIKTLIVTAAGEPVEVLNFGDRVLTQPCPKRRFIDVTGAGDTFIGCFLVSQLDKEELEISVRKSIAVAQDSLQWSGTWDNGKATEQIDDSTSTDQTGFKPKSLK